MTATPTKQRIGGDFIISELIPEEVFIPELMSDDHRMIRDMIQDFFDSEIKNKLDDIDQKKDWNITIDLMKKMGDLGLLGAHMPVDLGGMELDSVADTIIAETIGKASSFNVTFAAHTGIGMLPILFFGTEDQKKKYLPGLISGDLKASYCLTEPSSGSDALAAKTKAILDGDDYILNGQKMWITNAGFADVFIVFAQVDGDKFTGFVVDRDSSGLSLGEEEHKLGIHGSSTRQVFLENVRVSKNNVLGEVGKGHLIAFNVLNIGRYKLAVMCMGANKDLITQSVQYANQREQFKVPISSFGAIQHKIAEQSIRNYALESAIYRVADDLTQHSKYLQEVEGLDYSDAKLQSAEEFAIECAILKVAGSEILDYVSDECVQIHGGMGYSEEGKIARAYRDARINRIFEGTNEINRLLIVDMLMKRALKGVIDIVGPAWEVQKELTKLPSFSSAQGKYEAEKKAIKDFKKLALMVLGGAAKKQMDGEIKLKVEQEILMNGADLLIQIFLAESLLVRVQQRETHGLPQQEIYDAMLQVFVHDTNWAMQKTAFDAIASFTSGDLLKTFQMGVKRFTSYPLQNTKELRRQIAKHQIEHNEYSI